MIVETSEYVRRKQEGGNEIGRDREGRKRVEVKTRGAVFRMCRRYIGTFRIGVGKTILKSVSVTILSL